MSHARPRPAQDRAPRRGRRNTHPRFVQTERLDDLAQRVVAVREDAERLDQVEHSAGGRPQCSEPRHPAAW